MQLILLQAALVCLVLGDWPGGKARGDQSGGGHTGGGDLRRQQLTEESTGGVEDFGELVLIRNTFIETHLSIRSSVCP